MEMANGFRYRRLRQSTYPVQDATSLRGRWAACASVAGNNDKAEVKPRLAQVRARPRKHQQMENITLDIEGVADRFSCEFL